MSPWNVDWTSAYSNETVEADTERTTNPNFCWSNSSSENGTTWVSPDYIISDRAKYSTYGTFQSIETMQELSTSKYLTDELIEDFKDSLNWNKICKTKEKLTDEFIEKYKDYISWFGISGRGNLTDEFLEKYKDYIDWSELCSIQDLTEKFITKYCGRLDWMAVSLYQKLSLNFMINNVYLLNLYDLQRNDKIEAKDYEKIKKIKNLITESPDFKMSEIRQTEDILENWLR